MRVQEMREREDIDSILRATLSSAWNEMLGRPVQVVESHTLGAKQWNYQSLLGGYFTNWPDKKVRHFLRDGFRATPIRKRIVPQWILGTQLSTRLGLRATSTPAFGVVNGPQNSNSTMILPGNQRVRIFDFSTGIVRVVLKEGYPTQAMTTENSVRSSINQTFILPIQAHCPNHKWFEEEIFNGFALPRVPPCYPAQHLTNSAMRLLSEWSAPQMQNIDTTDFVGDLRSQCNGLLGEVRAKFPDSPLTGVESSIDKLSIEAERLPETLIGPSHGDFQPGNILVGKRNHQIKIIDWEHFGQRSSNYDRLILGLSTRSPSGLDSRWAKFISATDDSETIASLPKMSSWRRSTAALVALQDLIWYLHESLSGPYTSPSPGLLLQLKSIGTGVLFR